MVLRLAGNRRPTAFACLAVVSMLTIGFAGCLSDESTPAAPNSANDGTTASGGAQNDDGAADSGTKPAPTEANETAPASPQNVTAPTPVATARKAAVVTFAGCVEYTARVPVALTTLSLGLPEGFVVKTTDAAGTIVDIVLRSRVCPEVTFENSNVQAAADEEEVGELWTGVEVTPPADLNPAPGTHYWPITWSVASAPLLEVYQAWGMSAFATDATVAVTYDADTAAAVVRTVIFEPAPARYRFSYAFALGAGGPEVGTTHVWIPAEGGTLGSVQMASSGGGDVATGSGLIRQNGDATFPTVAPMTAGYVADVATQTTVSLL